MSLIEGGKRHTSQKHNCRKFRRLDNNKEYRTLWEYARGRKDDNERKKLVTDLFAKLKQRGIKTNILRHDMSRIIQFLLKYGDNVQRKEIFESAKDDLLRISQEKYGQFVTSKLLKYFPPSREFFMKELSAMEYKKFMRLISNKYSHLVVESVYRTYMNSGQQALLIQRMHGPQCVLYTSEKDFLAHVYDDSLEVLKKLISKGLFGESEITQRFAYSLLCKVGDSKDIIERDFLSILDEFFIHILHGKYGLFFSVKLLCYADPKMKKKLVKECSKYLSNMLTDEYGSIAAILLCCIVDDTKTLTNKLILPISESFQDLLDNRHSFNFILFLLSGLTNQIVKEHWIGLITECKNKGLEYGTTKKPLNTHLNDIRNASIALVEDKMRQMDPKQPLECLAIFPKSLLIIALIRHSISFLEHLIPHMNLDPSQETLSFVLTQLVKVKPEEPVRGRLVSALKEEFSKNRYTSESFKNNNLILSLGSLLELSEQSSGPLLEELFPGTLEDIQKTLSDTSLALQGEDKKTKRLRDNITKIVSV